MKVTKIQNRNVVFTFRTDFDQNVHLIKGVTYNFIIDTGLGQACMEPVLDSLETDSKPIIIVNTHHHWDHIWGNGSFRNPILVSHRRCRELIQEKWDEMLGKYGQYSMGRAEQVLPTLVFENELYFPEDRVRLFYTPGHTIDSISVLDEEEHVFNVGDNIGDSADAIVPNIYTSKAIYKDTIMRYKDVDAHTWISGHNGICEREVLERILEELN